VRGNEEIVEDGETVKYSNFRDIFESFLSPTGCFFSIENLLPT